MCSYMPVAKKDISVNETKKKKIKVNKLCHNYEEKNEKVKMKERKEGVGGNEQ